MSKITDLDKLQGSWRVTELELDGQAMAAEMLRGGGIVIEGRRFTSHGMGAEYKGIVSLDESARPRRLDLEFDSGPEKGNRNLGIYELAGDTWRLCLATRGHQRPISFATKAGSGIALETLERGEAVPVPGESKAARPADVAPTPLEGEWQMLSGVMSGKTMDGNTVRWVKRVTEGSRTTVKAGPQTIMQFEFTADFTRSSGEIDYRNTAGPHIGKRQLGIFAVEDDVLRVCVAAPGDHRPTAFESKPGDGRTLTAWKRLR